MEPKGICVAKFPQGGLSPVTWQVQGAPALCYLTQISQLLAHVFSERKSVPWLQFFKNLGHFTGKFRIHRVKLAPSFRFTSVLESCNCMFIDFVSFSYWCMDEHDLQVGGSVVTCPAEQSVILTTPFPHQQTFVLVLLRLTLFLLPQTSCYSLSHVVRLSQNLQRVIQALSLTWHHYWSRHVPENLPRPASPAPLSQASACKPWSGQDLPYVTGAANLKTPHKWTSETSVQLPLVKTSELTGNINSHGCRRAAD